MKKLTFIINIFAAIFLMSLTSRVSATETMEINDALKKGIISVSIAGMAKGELLELRVARLTATPVIIVINKGRTNISGQVSVLSLRKDSKIDLSSKYEDAIVLPQTGAERYNRGPKDISAGDPLCYLYCVID